MRKSHYERHLSTSIHKKKGEIREFHKENTKKKTTKKEMPATVMENTVILPGKNLENKDLLGEIEILWNRPWEMDRKFRNWPKNGPELTETARNWSKKENESYDCGFCERKLKTKANLQRHQLIHTGERPYSCPICDQHFRYQKTLKLHVCK